MIFQQVYDLFKDSSKYTAVSVSGLVFKKGDKGVKVIFYLCLAQNKSHDGSIEDIFENQIKTGNLFTKPVLTGSFELMISG